MNIKISDNKGHNYIISEINKFYCRLNIVTSLILSAIYVIIALYFLLLNRNSYLFINASIMATVLFLIFILLRKDFFREIYAYKVTYFIAIISSFNVFLKIYLTENILLFFHFLLLIISLSLLNPPFYILLAMMISLITTGFYVMHLIADFTVIKALILPTFLSVIMGITFHFAIKNILFNLMSLKIEAQKKEQEKEHIITELKQAVTEIKTLSGLLPICASCKKIRDDKCYWNKIEKYISHHSEVQFSHGICPDCAKELYPGIDL